MSWEESKTFFYAIDITLINSITQSVEVTKIPNLPKHTEGVINL